MMETLTQSAPSLIVPAGFKSIDEKIEARRRWAHDPKAYRLLGYLQKIVFDPAGMDLPKEFWTEPVICPNMLQWLEEDPRNCPALGISASEQDLLILGSLPQPSELPGDVTDLTQYVKTDAPGWASRGGMKPRLWPQRYSDRTRSTFGKNGEWLVIQPVFQVMFYPVTRGDFHMLLPSAGADGSQMAFLVNPKTKEAHFIGGSFLISSRIHRA
jgi:hypothetical protein